MSVLKTFVKKSKFCVIKFTSNEKIASVPGSWISVEEKEEKSESGKREVKKVSCFWNSQLSESELIRLTMDMKKPDKGWDLYDVEILAEANNVAEVYVKENMAKSGTRNIDEMYAQEEQKSRKMRATLKRKKKDANYTDGEGLSTEREDSNPESSSEEEDEVSETEPLATPQESIFEENTRRNDSFEEMKHEEVKSTANTSPDANKDVSADLVKVSSSSESVEDIKAKAKNDGDDKSNTESEYTEQVNQNTWHVVEILEADGWHVVPHSWIDIQKQTCLHPPAEQKRKTISRLVREQKEPDPGTWQTWNIIRTEKVTDDYISARTIRDALNEDNNDIQTSNEDKNNTTPEEQISLETADDCELSGENNGESTSNLKEKFTEQVDLNTWHVVKMLQTDKWHVVPSFWMNTEIFDCWYPPEGEKKKRIRLLVKKRETPNDAWDTLKVVEIKTITGNYIEACNIRAVSNADDADLEDDLNKLDKANENQVPKPPPLKKPKLISNVTLSKTQRYSYKQSSSFTDAELDSMDVRKLLKTLVRQNEEIMRMNSSINVELKENRCAIEQATLNSGLSCRDIFPIKTFKRLVEVEEQLKVEEIHRQEKKKLPKDNMTDRVTNYFNSQGGKDGHTCMINIMKNSFDDRVQVEYSLKGKGEKLKFCELYLYKLLKESVVKQYQHKNYKSTDADTSIGNWLKGATKRIEQPKTTNDVKTSTKKRQLQRLVQEEEKALADI